MTPNHLTLLEPVFRSVLKLPELKLNAELTPSDLPEWSSLNHVRLIAAIEKEFDMKFTLDDLLNIRSVDDILQVLNSRRNT